MQVSISIGQNHHYLLKEALLIYQSNQDMYGRQSSFVTHHGVRMDGQGRIPKLGAAKPLSLAFIRSLVQSLGGYLAVEYLPDHVLARTDRIIAWWTKPQTRHMYFGDKAGHMTRLTGKIFPQPALVWIANGKQLTVRALKENRRPTPKTKLCVAPYWNLYADGRLCQGTMRSPKNSAVASIKQWEESFYASEFTHGNVGRLTRHKGGFEGLWKSLAGREQFPLDSLIELPEKLDQLLTGKRQALGD